MLLKELRRLWADGSIMENAIKKLGEMMRDAEYVYTHAWEACAGQAVASRVTDTLKQHDKDVNRGERRIRRMVVEHLSLNPRQDVSGCMAIMIMAKDVERLGDHSRNIFRIAERLGKPVTSYQLFDDLNRQQKAIGEMFPVLYRAILDSSNEQAHDVLSRYQQNKGGVKALQDKVFETEMPSREAVNTTLLMRFLMRTNAHMGNAASGICFPLEDIDFVSRGLRKEKEDNK